MKPHLDSRSNFNRYQHSGATVTVDRSFVKNGKSQNARAVAWGAGVRGKEGEKEEVKVCFKGNMEKTANRAGR